jgi:site-specific recombinase XerD
MPRRVENLTSLWAVQTAASPYTMSLEAITAQLPVLKRLFNFLIAEEVIKTNPIAKLPPPEIEQMV